MTFKKDKRQETIIYLVLWGLFFIAPVLSLYIRTAGNDTLLFDWHEVFVVWRQYAVFFAIFLLHNHLLAPMLVYRQRKTLYVTVLTVLLALFVVYQCHDHPSEMQQPGGPRHEMAHGPRHGMDGGHHEPPPFDGERPDGARPLDGEHPDGHRPHFRPEHKPEHKPPIIFGQHDIIAVVCLILMLGANLGVKLFFKQQRDQQKLSELRRQNLEQQLEHLKYQINPHFLMNTLNNIHALVDIDAERAKETIIELSRIMRFVLYEGSKQTVPLAGEIEFLSNYIRLMQLRVSDKVKVTVSLPQQLPDAAIPPLMLITFVENAFKHGVSYQQPSFIDIDGHIADGQLVFSCRNSKIPAAEDSHGGVGLKNVRQRLRLIYGDRYTLNITDDADTYNILLKIPL
jgi:two-component sensor histidine kinase